MSNGDRAGFFARLLRQDTPEDPKRLVLLVSAATLVVIALALVLPAAIWVGHHGDLGRGVVAVIIAVAGFLSGLAGYAHKKPDDQLPGGPQ